MSGGFAYCGTRVLKTDLQGATVKISRLLAWAGALGVLTVLAVVPRLWAQSSTTQTTAEKVTVPAGTKLYVRLVTPVSTKTSHLHDTVTTRVVREVPGSTGVAVPLGAQPRVEPRSGRTPRPAPVRRTQQGNTCFA